LHHHRKHFGIDGFSSCWPRLVHRCGRYDRGRYGLYRYSGLHYDGRCNRGYGSHRYHGLRQYWGIVLSWHSRGYY